MEEVLAILPEEQGALAKEIGQIRGQLLLKGRNRVFLLSQSKIEQKGQQEKVEGEG